MGIAAKTYRCRICGFRYLDGKLAKQCEAWCKKHKSCNLELIKKAVK